LETITNVCIGNFTTGRHCLQNLDYGPLARELGNLWVITDMLNAWGIQQLGTGKAGEAAVTFREALEKARKMGNQELAGKALFGLAQAMADLGDVAEARRIGQECLEVLQSFGSFLADEVADWLASDLPPEEAAAKKGSGPN
jgi:hypothetical protein